MSTALPIYYDQSLITTSKLWHSPPSFYPTGQFPGEHGLVAPGMSCHYGVRFAPDALMDYDDEIRIQTQSSQPIIIPLQGRRQPPLISRKDLDGYICIMTVFPYVTRLSITWIQSKFVNYPLEKAVILELFPLVLSANNAIWRVKFHHNIS